MRTSLPPVRLQMHPSMFDLMMTVLENNAGNAPDGDIRRNAKNLMDKRMKYTRFCPGNGDGYVSVRMYESEAAETIWQLLLACAEHCEVAREYSKELDGGDSSGLSPGRDEGNL